MKSIALRRRASAAAFLMLWSVLPACADDLSGTVREAGTSLPIEGAVVSLQASNIRTTTAADGSYTLAGVSGSNLVIVAAKRGYFNTSTTASTPAVGIDILLDPVPQADDPNYVLEAPETCASCHPNQYNEWLGTAMADAGLNTWVHDVYNGTGTSGGMGGFVYTRDSIFAGSNPNSECASCHQPELWIDAPFDRMENPLDAGYPTTPVVHGISCEVCHKIADVDVAKVNFPGIFPGAVTFTRPQGPSFAQVQYGVLADTSFSAPSLMRPSYQPQIVAETCAACHQDKNDPNENHTYDGVISEPTYLEWAASPYGDVNSPLYANCVDCHMPPSGETTICTVSPVTRDPNTVRSHTIEGTTPYYLENAVEMVVHTGHDGDTVSVDVSITNHNTGHHVPTGVTIRNMILLVEAWRESDGQPLAYAGTQTVHDLGGVGDAAQGYYAGLPGKFFSKVNHNSSGQGPTFFTDATGIQFDNRIPALATDDSFYIFTAPGSGGDIHVRVRLIYRRAFRFLVDAKQWTEDGHGNPLADLAPPHFGHPMEIVEQVVTVPSADFDGDGDVDISDFAVFAQCFGGTFNPPGPVCPPGVDADLDGDGDVDLTDFARFAQRFTGASF